MKNIKKISIVLFIALLHNLFLASCTDKTVENNSEGDITDNSEVNNMINVTEPAISALTYEGDFSGAFSNPERGYYKRVDVTGKDDFTDIKNLGITVAHSYVPLYTYLGMTGENPWDENVPEKLPETLLENLRTGLNAIREAGIKVILRPAYAWDWTPPVIEHLDTVKSHLAQIYEIISENADVVMGLEAGILGPWGEWHSDGIYTDANSENGAAFRYELFKYILDNTPDNIPVRLRYPFFIKEMLYLGVNPPEGQDAMTQAQMDRIAYHDDSFMVDENDWGSYNPRDVWWGKLSGLSSNRVTNETFRQWMYEIRTSSGGNILMGGEMEWGDDTLSHETSVPPLRVLTEMANLHTTEISTDYNPEHINLWRETDVPASDIGEPAETVYDRIERRLGYRLRLTEAEVTTAERAGGKFEITAVIINDGFAGIVKSRPAYIVLDDGKKRYEFPLHDVDVRMWQPGTDNAVNVSFTLPEDIPGGLYTIALWLPDAFENLRMRPEYSVRFANKNIWDSKNGYNKLGELAVIP